jgi:predicted PurR-regulated permease PerM
MKNKTKLETLKNWFLNKWFFAIIIFIIGVLIFLPKIFDSFKSVSQEVTQVKKNLNNHPEDWNKAYNCFEIGYSRIMIVN